jgi:hypothetical protein
MFIDREVGKSFFTQLNGQKMHTETKKKVTLFMNSQDHGVLRKLSRDEAMTSSGVLRKALALFSLVRTEKSRGLKIVVADSNDRVIKEILV